MTRHDPDDEQRPAAVDDYRPDLGDPDPLDGLDLTPADLNMDLIAACVTEAGFCAYVEQTGGGCATIYASRTADPNRPGYPAADHDGHHDAAAGPGWFAGPGWTDPRASAAEFYVGPDDDGEADALTVTTEDAAVAALVALLAGLDQ